MSQRYFDRARYSFVHWLVAILLLLLLILLWVFGKGPGSVGCCGGGSAAVADAAPTATATATVPPLPTPAPMAAPTPEPAAPTVAAPEPVCGADSIRIDLTNMVTNSAELPEQSMASITAAAKCIGDKKYEIAGHTDNVGPEGLNLALSKRRAQAVHKALVGLGAKAANLSVKGYGSKKPVADNNTEEGRAQNRRVELVPR